MSKEVKELVLVINTEIAKAGMDDCFGLPISGSSAPVGKVGRKIERLVERMIIAQRAEAYAAGKIDGADLGKSSEAVRDCHAAIAVLQDKLEEARKTITVYSGELSAADTRFQTLRTNYQSMVAAGATHAKTVADFESLANDLRRETDGALRAAIGLRQEANGLGRENTSLRAEVGELRKRLEEVTMEAATAMDVVDESTELVEWRLAGEVLLKSPDESAEADLAITLMSKLLEGARL